MIIPTSRWQRVAITALLVLPLLLIVVLSAPAWAALPFLSGPRRDAVLKFLGCLIDWIKAIPGSTEPRPIASSISRDAPVSRTTPEPLLPDAGEQTLQAANARPGPEPCPALARVHR